MHCLWEIIDNSVDEALAGTASRIEVVLHADGSVEVRDDGRGIPVDIEPKTGLSGVEVVLTKLHAGGKFGGGSYAASGGLHGVGASVVNALSARLDVEVDRGGKTYGDELPPRRAGHVRRPAGAEPRGDRSPRRAGCAAGRRQGQARRDRHPGPLLAGPRRSSAKDAELDLDDELATRARQTAFLVPGLTLVVRDERGCRDPGADGAHEETFVFDGGITEFVEFLAPDRAGHRRVAAAGRRQLQRDRAGARRPAAT